MFVLQPKPTFKAAVSIPVPGGSDGKITFIFKHKGKKDLQAYFNSLSATEGEAKTDIEALLELVDGWEGVSEKFSAENLELLLDAYPGAALALYETYRKELLEGRSKN